jgi:hypothetical protein
MPHTSTGFTLAAPLKRIFGFSAVAMAVFLLPVAAQQFSADEAPARPANAFLTSSQASSANASVVHVSLGESATSNPSRRIALAWDIEKARTARVEKPAANTPLQPRPQRYAVAQR